jgi:hypothetical protein
MEKKYKTLCRLTRYIFRNIRRYVIKSLLTAAVICVLFIALGQFISARQSVYALFDALPVKITFFDNPAPYVISNAENAGFFTGLYMEYYGGIVEVDNHPPKPRASGHIHAVPFEFVVTNDIRRNFGRPLHVEYLPGYDGERIMNSPDLVCILLNNQQDGIGETLGVGLGDQIEITRYMPFPHTLVYTIVGWVVMDGGVSDSLVVYIPPGESHRALFPRLPFSDANIYYDFAEFTMIDNHQIDEMRSQLRRRGIDDGQYLIDTYALDRIGDNIRIYDMLFPIITAVLVIIGGLLPGLIILHSAKEAALLRITGTTRKHSLVILVGQQLLLCAVGLIMGLVGNFLLTVYTGGGLNMFWETGKTLGLCFSFFSVACLTAAFICANVAVRPKTMELLQTRE